MARTTDGGYFIAWEKGPGDFEQRYDSSGQPVGGMTAVPQPTEDLSPSRATRTSTTDGGYLEIQVVWTQPTSQLSGSNLYVQHFSADGTPVDAPILLGQAPQGGWQWAWLSMPDGAVALVYQGAARVFTTPLINAMLRPQ